MRKQMTVAAIASLFLGGMALAQQGVTSGPAAGKHVTPSTAVQKLYEGRSTSLESKATKSIDASSKAAGSPGVEGKAGTQSGEAAQGRKTPSKSLR